MEEAGINSDEETEVLILALRRLGIKGKNLKEMSSKNESRGRKQTSKELRSKIWDFWHQNSDASMITSRPAKIRLGRVPKLQTDLPYHSGVTEFSNKQNIKMLVSPWQITSETYRVLLAKFREQNNVSISMGTFLSLRPFYVRTPNFKDIEMCVCKVHLHVRWAIEALIKLTQQQHIKTDFPNYEEFFNVIYSPHCVLPEGSSEYIKWPCTPSAKDVCEEIGKNFNKLKSELISKSDDQVTVKMLQFVKKEEQTKKGKVVKRLKAESVEANVS